MDALRGSASSSSEFRLRLSCSWTQTRNEQSCGHLQPELPGMGPYRARPLLIFDGYSPTLWYAGPRSLSLHHNSRYLFIFILGMMMMDGLYVFLSLSRHVYGDLWERRQVQISSQRCAFMRPTAGPHQTRLEGNVRTGPTQKHSPLQLWGSWKDRSWEEKQTSGKSFSFIFLLFYRR